MKNYIVEANESVMPPNASGGTAIELLKQAHEAFRGIVEDFAKKHPGKIIVGEGAWINNTLRIEAEPAVAQELSKVPGIGKVDGVSRPLQPESKGKRHPRPSL